MNVVFEGRLMIPKWKLKRELGRLKVQAKALPYMLYEPYVQRRYDAQLSDHISVTKGNVSNTGRIAIFLIFQPTGVSQSVIRTCCHLVEAGFSPVVVSNGTVSTTDLKALTDSTHLVAERPNFGYDFGGYRDGLWLLNEKKIAPDEILFLNDSVWFPVWSQSDMLAEMQASEGTYIGTQVFGDTSSTAKKRGMFVSYCFLIKAPLINHIIFKEFWSQYKLSSNKEVTLRRGERAFSHLMLENADVSNALYSQERFERMVSELKGEDLRYAVQDFVALDPKLDRIRRNLMEQRSSVGWEETAKNLFLEGTRTKNYIGAAPILSLSKLKFPMIKKNNERLYKLARSRISIALKEGRLPGLDPIIASELTQKIDLAGSTL